MQATQTNGGFTRKLTTDEQADLDAINSSIDRLHSILPPDPYILTIPQDVEPRYHHPHRYPAGQWLEIGAFHSKESEMTQYQTFIYHDPATEMYLQRPSRPAEDEVGMGRKSGVATGANTPRDGPGGVAKKKISLDAYKKGKVGGKTPALSQEDKKKKDKLAGMKEEEKVVKQAAVKGPVERVRAETEEVLAAVADEVGEEVPELKGADEEVKDAGERKRKRGSEDPTQDKPRDSQPEAREEPAAKKARPSSPPPASSQPAKPSSSPHDTPKSPEKAHAPPPSKPEDEGLPPRLSPLTVPSMPARLSPTLPENIAATLKARETLKASTSPDTSAPNSVTKNGKLTPHQKPTGVVKHKSPVPRNGFRANSSSPAVRSDAEDKQQLKPHDKQLKPPTSSPAPRVKTPELSQDEEKAIGQALKASKQASNGGKQSLMVKLKYKKAQRESVRRILKMPARPSRAVRESMTPQPPAPSVVKTVDEARSERAASGTPALEGKALVKKRDPNAKGVAQKIGPVAKKVKEAMQEDVTESAVEERPAMVEKRSEEPLAKTQAAEKKAEPEKPTAKRKHSSEGDADKTKSKKKKAEPNRPTTKRKHSSDEPKPPNDEPPAKRKKVPAAIEVTKDPSTPLQPDLQSPSLLSSTQKSQQVTPSLRKDHLSAVAMARERSTDGNAADTPSSVKSSTPAAKSSTPVPSGSQVNGAQARAPSSAPSSRTPMQQAWETEQKRLEGLGRELKHTATAHLNNMSISDAKAKEAEKQFAAIKSVESLLCYVLAFTATDEAAAAADPKQSPSTRNWRSLQPFLGFVKRNTDSFPLLQGLASHLGEVFNAHILSIITKQSPEQQRAASSILTETYATVAKCASDAEAKLDLDTLMDAFPQTWGARTKGSLAAERMTPGDFTGGFKLPFGVQTSPVCAARAGYGMLSEWVQAQGVEYGLKLKLKKEQWYRVAWW